MFTKKVENVDGREGVTWHYLRQEEWEELAGILEEDRMTVEEFWAEGEVDTLTDGFLRDLWLKYKYYLFYARYSSSELETLFKEQYYTYH